MKKFFIILFTLFLGLFINSCTKEVDQSKLQQRNGIFYEVNKKTPFTGKVVSIFENGQKKFEAIIKQGKFNGIYSEWYDNGQKKEEANYKNGEYDGLWISWYYTG